MNTIPDYNIWERRVTVTNNVRYFNLTTGHDIPRSQYDAAVIEGTIIKSPEGSTNFTITYKYFVTTETRHRIISSTADDLTSLSGMANANKNIGALPSNTSVWFRLLGNMEVTDGGIPIALPVAMQTRPWDAVQSALSEMVDLLDLFKTTTTYGTNLSLEIDKFEVVYREIL